MQIGTTPVYTTPAYSSPVNTTCYGYGTFAQCTSTGGQVYGGQTYGGQVYSYDANAGLRRNVLDQCMASQGYRAVSFPTCTSEQARAGVISPNARPLPAASDVLCANDNGYVLRR
jgi:hypothetical protein